jgi:hypothetical protein
MRAMSRSLLCALALIAAFAAHAADSPFVVERIDVRNATRVSPRLIAAESLLRAGHQYSDDDLRDAAARLNRLPFLAAAAVTTEPGSAAGQRVVVITVTETKAFSFLLDEREVILGKSRTGLSNDYDFPDPAAPWKNAAAGVRHVIGNGEAHLGLTVLRTRRGYGKNYTAWELGYTGYDLFDTRAFATAKIRTPVDSVGERHFTPELLVGLPLSASRTVSVDFEDTTFRDDTASVGGSSFRRLDAERQITLDWTYDTLNAPYAPTRGTLLRVAPVLFMGEFTSFILGRPPAPPQPRADHTTAHGIEVDALRVWELSERDSVSAGLFGGWANLETKRTEALSGKTSVNPGYEILQVGYSHALRASRVELQARAVKYQDNVFDQAFEFSASWVRRSRWGNFRLGVGYVSAY